MSEKKKHGELMCQQSVAVTDSCPPPTGPMYRLEKQTEPNVPVELESTLESQSTLEFCLVRENSE